MNKFILISLIGLFNSLLGFSQENTTVNCDSLIKSFTQHYQLNCDDQLHYSVNTNICDIPVEKRYAFFQELYTFGIYPTKKYQINEDKIVFNSTTVEKDDFLLLVENIIKKFINSDTSDKEIKVNSDFPKAPLAQIVVPCQDAEVSCSGNVYTYQSTHNSATTQYIPPIPSGSPPYPYYGCLSSQPCPSFFYMQVQQAGDIIIQIDQVNLLVGPLDVDFICWGPFTSLTQGCTSGMTQSKVVDCSYSGAASETCTIANAHIGDIYILMLTNYAGGQPPNYYSGIITFSQSGGSGITNCDIVENCGILSFLATPTACIPASNTFDISGTVEFVNPPAAGTLTITDNTAVPPVSQSFNVAVITSPLSFNLNNITCDGNIHSLTVEFSDDNTCTSTINITSPPEACPDAQISGNFNVCNDGTSTVQVPITLTGVGPYDIQYAIDGTPQPIILDYVGSSPYLLTTGTAGNYTLVSINNDACAGTVSGSATVTSINQPTPGITGSASACLNQNYIYSTEAGKVNYFWNVSPGATIIAGGTATDPSISVTWKSVGNNFVSVNYGDPLLPSCTSPTSTIFNVVVDTLPFIQVGSDFDICQDIPAMLNAIGTNFNNTSVVWSENGAGTLDNYNILNPTYSSVIGESGNITFITTVNGTGACSTQTDSDTILLNVLSPPLSNAGLAKVMCANSTVSLADATASNAASLLWSSSGTGSFSNSTLLNPTYTPSAADTAAHAVDLRLIAYGNSPCNPDTSWVHVTINPQPVSFAGIDERICETTTLPVSTSSVKGAQSLSWNSSGTGGFNNASILHPVYTPSAADIAAGVVTLTLNVTAYPSCTNQSDAAVLRITRQPVTTAGADDKICQNRSFTVNAATSVYDSLLLWTTNGTGTLSNTTTISPTYSPSAGESGSVQLRLHATPRVPCAAVNDTMLLRIDPLPTATINPATGQICQGNPYVFAPGVASATAQNDVIWRETGAGSLSGATTFTPTYTPLPGEVATVNLSMTAHGRLECASDSATAFFQLTLDPEPTANAGPDATICSMDTYTLSGGATFASFTLWTTSGTGTFNNAGILNPIYTPSTADTAAGLVTLTLEAHGIGTCIDSVTYDAMILHFDDAPVANAGPDEHHCVNAPITLSGAYAWNNTGYFWTKAAANDGTFNPNPPTNILTPDYMPGNLDFFNGTATLTLHVQGRMACASKTVTDSKVLFVSPYPTVDAGVDDYICSDQTQHTFSGTGNNYNAGTINWTFSGGDGIITNANTMTPTYFPGPVDLSTVDRSIDFYLRLQGVGECSTTFVTDTVNLLIDPTPISLAGPDDFVCGQRPYLLNATSLYADTITWRSTGTGLFNDTTILNPTYTPSAADVGGNIQLQLWLKGCQGLTNADFMVLHVYPDPSATMSGTASICEGTSTPISVALTGTAPWSITYTNGVTPVTVNNIMASPYVFNVSPTVNTTWWLVSGSDGHCSMPSDSIHGLAAITVNAVPSQFLITVTNGGIFCEGDVGVDLGLSGSELGMQYELYRNGAFTGNMLPGTGGPLNYGTYDMPAQYYVRALNPVGNCEAFMNDTVVIIMNPTPVTDFVSSVSCMGDSTCFSPFGAYINNVSNWTWSFGDGQFFTSNTPMDTVCHQYNTWGTFIATLFVTDTNSCSFSISHPVVVLPLPVSFFRVNTPNCAGMETYFEDLSSTDTGYIDTWVWTWGDGSPSETFLFPNSPNTTHLYPGPGTYTVNLHISTNLGCEDDYSFDVTVSQNPTAGFIYTTDCAGLATEFTDQSTDNGGGQIVAWHWDFGDPPSGALNFSNDTNPVHIYSNPGTYAVQLIVVNSNGCSDTLTINNITIAGPPAVDFTYATACLNSPTQFTSTVNAAQIGSYYWQFGDNNTSNDPNPTHIYAAAGTYTVSLTVTNLAGCEATISHTLTINPLPHAQFSATAEHCLGDVVQFDDQSSVQGDYITSWTWRFGDGNSQTINHPSAGDVSHTYQSAASFQVWLKVTDSHGCADSVSMIVNVHEKPLADFSMQGHCAGSEIQFINESVVTGTSVITQYSWDFGDPASGTANISSLEDPAHSYTNAGTYTISLTVTTNYGCSHDTTFDIDILALPDVSFTASNACAGNAAQFIADAEAGAIQSYDWDFGDGNTGTGSATSHVYNYTGTYLVTLTVTDTSNCQNSYQANVVIYPAPDALFSFTTPGCQGDTVVFTDASTLGGGGYIARWYWDFGDGSTANYLYPNAPATVNHSYSQAGTFNITLIVKTNDSCSSQITRTLVVHEKPQALFSFGTACEGMQVSFTDMSSYTGGNISAWQWDFGDPPSGAANSSTQQNPSHIYADAGSYNVSLIAFISEGCSDTAHMSITVHAPPAVGFSMQESCNNDTTFFVSSDSVQMGAIESWAWDFGDNTTSILTDPIHIYANAGMYTVILTVTDTSGCSNTRIKPVTVWQGPTADFAVAGAGCAGGEVTFSDMSQANGGNITQWYWDFGDGHDTTLTAPVSELYHTYSQPGNFEVTLIVNTQQGCSSQQQRLVNISSSPQASFTWSNTCQGNATQFTDQTDLNGGSGITAWYWDFGDPASGNTNHSSLQNPSHVFTNTGSYLVQLISTNAAGCSDTLVDTIVITTVPGVDFYTGTTLCEGGTVQFYVDNTVTPVGSIEIYSWDFGDGSAGSNEANPQHSYAHASIYTVHLTVVDSNGCSNIRSREVQIHQGAMTQFASAQFCMQSPTLFTDYSQAPQGDTIVSWHWDFGVGATQADTSLLQNPEYTYEHSGTYSVALTTTTEHGCSSTQILPVQIWNLPTADFAYTTTPCSNGEVQFMDNSSSYQANITGWQWEFEPFQYSNEKNPAHTYYELDSCYDVTLQVTDSRGCLQDTMMQVCVPAAFEVTFNNTASCFGEPIAFTPELVAPVGDSLISLHWDFGDPASGSSNTTQLRKPEHTFTAVGYYTVRMDVTDINGCTYTEHKQVQVHALPQASFTYSAGICDSTMTFVSNSIDTAGAVAVYVWSYGDGVTDTIYAPDSTATHKYMFTGTYGVGLHIVDINGCESDYSDTIERSPCIIAEYTYSDTVCQNNTILFTDRSTCNQPIEHWQWNWGDGSAMETYDTLTGPVAHTFTQAGTFNVLLTVSTTMATQVVSDNVAYNVTVLPGPLAGFTGGSLCLGYENAFADTTYANGAISLYYNWDFGDTATMEDTSTLASPHYLYTAPGIYTPQLVVSNERGCTDTATLQLQVYSLPKAGWDNLISCNGHPTQFIDQSVPVAMDIPVTHWEWAITDSLGEQVAMLTGDTATWVFDMTGKYQVLLTVSDTNSCVDTLTKNMRVYTAPVGAIGYEESREEQGILQFTNGTVGAETWEWDFGNGEGSLAFEPQTKYQDDGSYTITMTALAANGCTDTVIMEYNMLYKALWVPNAFTPQGEIPGVSVWKPVGINLASYHVEVFDRHGVKMWESTKLDATGNPAEGWYGTYDYYKDKRCPQGVYVWRIKATFKDGTEWDNNDAGTRDKLDNIPAGTITLLR